MFTALGVSAATIELSGSEVALVPLIFFIVAGLIFLVPAALYRRWYFYRRRIKANVITAEYAPPAGFNPAEIGYMFDGKLREREVGATIIHLVQRGFLIIKKDEAGNKLIHVGPRMDSNLKTYEAKLVAEAEASPEGVTGDQLVGRLSKVSSQQFSAGNATKPFIFTQLVHEDLRKGQYVKGSALPNFIFTALKIEIVLSIVVLYLPLTLVWGLITLQDGSSNFSALGTLWLVALIFNIFAFIPMLIASMILTYIRGRIVGREWIITNKLERLWPQIVGFRQFVQMVESSKLEFHSKELETVTKNDTLPYAVALGFVKNWREIIG